MVVAAAAVVVAEQLGVAAVAGESAFRAGASTFAADLERVDLKVARKLGLGFLLSSGREWTGLSSKEAGGDSFELVQDWPEQLELAAELE